MTILATPIEIQATRYHFSKGFNVYYYYVLTLDLLFFMYILVQKNKTRKIAQQRFSVLYLIYIVILKSVEMP